MLTEQQIAEIEGRAQKATEGPWKEGRHDTISWDGGVFGPYKNVYIEGSTEVAARGWGENCLDNAAFIAHARQDIPALIETVRELRGVLGAARAWIEWRSGRGIMPVEELPKGVGVLASYEDSRGNWYVTRDDVLATIDAVLMSLMPHVYTDIEGNIIEGNDAD